jgi:hypothetical protein
MQPSKPEIEFGRLRRSLQSALEPLLNQQMRRSDIQLEKFNGGIDTPEGRPLEHTLRGQVISFNFEFRLPNDSIETIEVSIGHDASWNAMAFVASTLVDAPQTFPYAGNEQDWIEKVCASATATFDNVANKGRSAQ